MDYITSGEYMTFVKDPQYMIDWCLTSSEQFFSYIQDESPVQDRK
jgi:hypothetical protein